MLTGWFGSVLRRTAQGSNKRTSSYFAKKMMPMWRQQYCLSPSDHCVESPCGEIHYIYITWMLGQPLLYNYFFP